MRSFSRVSRIASTFLAMATVVANASLARADSFTISQVLSAPFASGLAAGSDGSGIAWVSRAGGERNIWFAPIQRDGSVVGRALTHYTEDDGIDLGDLAYIAQKGLVAYVRGGDLEYPDKPAANPASLTSGVTQEIYAVSVKGGAPFKVGVGHSPIASPAGDRLLFLKDGAVYSSSLRPQDKPTQLFVARGAIDSLRFSPDGKHLAFVSQRGDHSFIGVYTFSDQSLRWVDPSFALDLEPTWSPDGQSIAFIRLPVPKAEIGIGPHRSGHPWSIRLSSADGSGAREIFKAAPGMGSVFHPIASERQLQFVGSQIVFPSESDGWAHLYSAPLKGGSASLLTPGAYEIEWAVASSDGQSVIYSANAGDIDRRHLFRVDVNTRAVEPLTPGNGIETSPVALKDGAIAYIAADARHPTHPMVRLGNRVVAVSAAPVPTDFPADKLVEPQSVTMPMRAGKTAHGQLFLPADRNARHPAVIFMHGGPIRQMLAGWHYMDYYSNAYAMNQYLASHGYVVLSLNYRAGIGYGFDFREAENYGAQGASEYNDLLAAAEFLRARPDVDGAKIGLWGGSYGGYMTALGLARNSDLFAAGVDLHGVHDWYNWSLGVRERAPYYSVDIPDKALSTAWNSSPLAAIDSWHSPVLLIHGDDDHNVRFDETVRLVREFQERGLNYSELVFPDEIHGFLRHATWLKTYQATTEFLDKHLK